MDDGTIFLESLDVPKWVLVLSSFLGFVGSYFIFDWVLKFVVGNVTSGVFGSYLVTFVFLYLLAFTVFPWLVGKLYFKFKWGRRRKR